MNPDGSPGELQRINGSGEDILIGGYIAFDKDTLLPNLRVAAACC
jgi:hypothetical protein